MPLSPLMVLPGTAALDHVMYWSDKDGAVIVRDLFPPDHIHRVNAEIDAVLTDRVPGYGYLDNETALVQQGRNTKRMTSLAACSDAAVECMLHSLVLGYAERELAEHPSGIQLNMAQVIEIGPGEPEQVLHVDEVVWPEYVRGPGRPALMCSCMVALTDFTEENGATRVIPGSHRLDTQWETVTGAGSVPAAMTAGSVLFFKGRVAHAGGANRTQESRRGMTLTYCANWLKPEEATALSVTVDRARQLPPRMRELLGFRSVYGTYIDDNPQIMLWAADMGDVSSLLDS